MASDLKLFGYTKEIFAAIFGFWIANGEKPVFASYATLRKMTGASQPSVAEAIQTLKSKGFISTEASPGKRTKYAITIDAEILEHFRKSHPRKPVSPPYRLGVNNLNHRQLANLTTTSSISESRKKNKGTSEKTSPLKVKDATGQMTGGLPLAK